MTCAFCAQAAREIISLRERLEEMREERFQARAETADRTGVMMPMLGLTAAQAGLLDALCHAPEGCAISREAAFRAAGCREDAGEKTIDVHMVHLRRRMKPHGVTIDAVHGYGWRLAPGAGARVMEAVDASEPSSGAAGRGAGGCRRPDHGENSKPPRRPAQGHGRPAPRKEP